MWGAVGWSLPTLPSALPAFKMAAKEEKIRHLSEAGASYFRPCFTYPPICKQQHRPFQWGHNEAGCLWGSVNNEGKAGGEEKKTQSLQTTDRKLNTNPAGVGRGWGTGAQERVVRVEGRHQMVTG